MCLICIKTFDRYTCMYIYVCQWAIIKRNFIYICTETASVILKKYAFWHYWIMLTAITMTVHRSSLYSRLMDVMKLWSDRNIHNTIKNCPQIPYSKLMLNKNNFVPHTGNIYVVYIWNFCYILNFIYRSATRDMKIHLFIAVTLPSFPAVVYKKSFLTLSYTFTIIFIMIYI